MDDYCRATNYSLTDYVVYACVFQIMVEELPHQSTQPNHPALP